MPVKDSRFVNRKNELAQITSAYLLGKMVKLAPTALKII